MLRHLLHLCLILTLTFSVDIVYGEKGKVAKIIIKRGNVKVKETGRKVASISKGDWVSEGATLATGKKSFAKILFVDKSQMNLGPDSQMVIKSFPKKKAGIIHLMKGQLRSKVTKDYMNIKDKDQSKLFIKTKTAAMGVRGTDFQVNFNNRNQSTSLVTFSGEVRMVKLDPSITAGFNQRSLEQKISSPNAVSVRKGQVSLASPKTDKATTPVKLNPAQLNTLKKNEVGQVKGPVKNSGPKKQFRNVIPKGLDSKVAANDSNESQKAMESTLGKGQVRAAITAARIEKAAIPDIDSSGKVDDVTGDVTMRSGGYIDLKTAQYIQPPPESAYDPVTDTYMAPPEYGGFDPATGEYKNESFDLNEEGQFVAKINRTDEGGRGPASGDGKPLAPPPPLDPNQCMGCEGAEGPIADGGTLEGPPADFFEDIENNHEQLLEFQQNTGNVKFIINTQ